MLLLICCKVLSPECLEKTTLSMLRFLNLDLSVMAKLMEVTMLTLRLNVKHSTFAQLMELEVWPSTASSVLMVHSSTRTTSSVTGGSTLTAPLLRSSTLLMMKLLLSVKLLQELLLMLLVVMELLMNMLLLLQIMQIILQQKMRVLAPMRRRADEVENLEAGEITGGVEGVKEEEETLEVELEMETTTHLNFETFAL